LRTLPNISIIHPSTKEEMDLLLEFAYESKSPVIIRYPKASINGSYEFRPEKYSWGKSLRLKEGTNVSIWATGAEYQTAFQVSEILEKEKISSEIINSLFIVPFDKDTLQQVAFSKLIVTIEDNAIVGGLASIVDETLINFKHKGVLHFGWGNEVVPHGTVKGIKKRFNLTPDKIASKIIKKISHK
jgi:transketolase